VNLQTFIKSTAKSFDADWCLIITKYFLAKPTDVARNFKEKQEDYSESLENLREFAFCKNMLHKILYVFVAGLYCMFIACFNECFS